MHLSLLSVAVAVHFLPLQLWAAVAPDDGENAFFETAQAQYQLGLELKRAKSYKRAISALSKALDADPDHLDAHWVLAWTYVESGDPGRALAEFREVVRVGGDATKAAEARAAFARLTEQGVKPVWDTGALEVTVVDESNRPVAGAHVRGVLGRQSGVTGADGRCVFRRLWPGVFTIEVESDDGRIAEARHRHVTAGATALVRAVLLPPVGVVEVTVTGHGGQPVSAAKVQAEPGSKAGLTDEAGKCLLNGLVPGSHEVTVTREGYQPSVGTRFEVTAGETATVAVALAPRPGVIQGTVADHKGVGVGGLEVTTVPGEHVTITDRKGSFALTNIDPGTYELKVSQGSRTVEIPALRPAEVGPGESVVVDVRLPSPRLASRLVPVAVLLVVLAIGVGLGFRRRGRMTRATDDEELFEELFDELLPEHLGEAPPGTGGGPPSLLPRTIAGVRSLAALLKTRRALVSLAILGVLLGAVVCGTGLMRRARDTGSEAPDTWAEAPDAGPEAPDTGAEAPDTETEAPRSQGSEMSGVPRAQVRQGMRPVIASASDAERDRAFARVKRLGELDATLKVAWCRALESATGEPDEGAFLAASKLVATVPFLNPVWNADGSPNAEALQKYTQRLQSLSAETVAESRERLEQTSGLQVTPQDAALTLILEDSFF